MEQFKVMYVKFLILSAEYYTVSQTEREVIALKSGIDEIWHVIII